jgi:hypothetical protein
MPLDISKCGIPYFALLPLIKITYIAAFSAATKLN